MIRRFLTDRKGVTSTQAALSFAVFGLVAAFAIPTMMDRDGSGQVQLVSTLTGAGIDMTTTGSVRSGEERTTRYTVRRSVLQPRGNAPCIIFDSGRREGNC